MYHIITFVGNISLPQYRRWHHLSVVSAMPHPGDGAPVGCIVGHVPINTIALETLLLDRTHLYGDIIDCKIHIFVTLVFRRNQRGPIGLVHICTVACSSGLMK